MSAAPCTEGASIWDWQLLLLIFLVVAAASWAIGRFMR